MARNAIVVRNCEGAIAKRIAKSDGTVSSQEALLGTRRTIEIRNAISSTTVTVSLSVTRKTSVNTVFVRSSAIAGMENFQTSRGQLKRKEEVNCEQASSKDVRMKN